MTGRFMKVACDVKCDMCRLGMIFIRVLVRFLGLALELERSGVGGGRSNEWLIVG